jgi:hypothetical protein
MNRVFLFTIIIILTIACKNTKQARTALFKDAIPVNGNDLQIIGVTPLYDKDKINKKYTFHISDSEGLTYFRDSILSGAENFSMTPDDYSLLIYIINGKEAENPITVNPQNKNIIYNHKYYDFDPSQLEALGKKYPIDYRIENIVFESEEKYFNFILNHKTDTALLFYENITSEFPGQATIFIKKDSEVNSWEKGMGILKSEIKKITNNESEYLLIYTPQENETDKYQFGISSNESLYNKLQNPGFEKTSWIKKTSREIIAYWKK